MSQQLYFIYLVCTMTLIVIVLCRRFATRHSSEKAYQLRRKATVRLYEDARRRR